MTSGILKNNFLMSVLALTFVVLFFGVNQAHAAPICVTKWSELPQLKPINGISDFDTKVRNGSIQFKMPSGKTFTIRERSGNIYAETPEGNADIQLCKEKGNNKQLTAIANTILGKKVIVVHNTGGKKFQIIDQGKPNEPVTATVM
ncbi:MAG: hypothetical protein M9899_03945 [Bdellovibrionaceae bacterium]|nr:hypothetical protein [Pseudobdellovibrionaceae bacterium]